MYNDAFFQGVIIEHTGLQSVDVAAFQGLVSLAYLHLDNGQLINPPSLQYIRKTIVGLDLNYNRITHIKDTYFVGCEKLWNIQLEGNITEAYW